MDKSIKIKLLELEALLISHDWFYHMSDDNRYYESGKRSQQVIDVVCQELRDAGMVDEVTKLYEAYSPNISMY